MCSRTLSARAGRRISPLLQFRVWQFGLLVAFTAIAIVDIQGYCREPRLIPLASIGYAGYALLCWFLWHAIHRFESRLGPVLVVAVYAFVMGSLFLAATVAYLLIEYVYLGGRLSEQAASRNLKVSSRAHPCSSARHRCP